MLTLGTQATDLMSRFAGSAHARADMSQGDKSTHARDAHDAHDVVNNATVNNALVNEDIVNVVGGHVSQQDKDVLLIDKLQRVHRVLNVELSVNLSANFHRTQGPTSVPLYSESQFDAGEVVNNVMSFIKDRIEDGLAEGKTDDELAQLLIQAETGIAKGIAEAAGVLENMGLNDGDAVQGLTDVSEGLKQGIQELNVYLLEQLEIAEEGVAANPVLTLQPALNVQQVNYNHNESSNVTGLFERFKPSGVEQTQEFYTERSGARAYTLDETFDFEVKTTDGDIIRLNIGRGVSQESSFGMIKTGAGFGAAFSEQTNSYTNISYSITGDLDEDELAALDELFSKVDKLADSFFSGNLVKAFQQAMRLDYDAAELAGFSLNLSQAQTMTETYQEIAQLAEPVPTEQDKRPSVFDFFQPVGQFAKDLVDSMQEVEAHSPFDHVGELVSELLGKAVSDESIAVEQDEDEGELTSLQAYVRDFINEVIHQHKLLGQEFINV